MTFKNYLFLNISSYAYFKHHTAHLTGLLCKFMSSKLVSNPANRSLISDVLKVWNNYAGIKAKVKEIYHNVHFMKNCLLYTYEAQTMLIRGSWK